ncbi:MAG: cell envelope integrity protein TolA [Spirochaetales bacterium]|nr:cell envelope integrity protein TolA [Spirochaetales bacterium]
MKLRLWMIFIPIVLIFAVVFMFNRSVVSIHLNELSNAVDELNKKQRGFNTVDILFKYEINRRLYSGLITEAEYDREELKTISILTQQEAPERKLGIFDYISMPAVNGLRFLLGKPFLTLTKEQKENNAALSLAFYHENNRRFRDAQNIYNSFDEQKKQSPVLLHEGYCLSLLGEHDDAVEKLTRIINENRNEEIAATAAILLMYITDFKQKADYLIKNGKGDNIDTVVKLVQLNSFQNAQEMLDRLEKSDTDEEAQAKIAYYRGRLLEETGEKSKAIETYQEMILEYYRYEVAKNANRRILVMSANRSDREEINALAIENNKLLKDEEFENILELNENIGTTVADIVSDEDEVKKEEVIDVTLLKKLQERSVEKREYVEAENQNALLAEQEAKRLQEEKELREKQEALEKQRQEKIKKQKLQAELRRQKKLEQERKKAEQLRLKKERERQKALEKAKELERLKAIEKAKAEEAEKAKNAELQKKKVEENGDYSIEYYRKDGKLSQVDQFNKEGKKTGYLKYVYDENGNRIRIDTYDENDQLVEYY